MNKREKFLKEIAEVINRNSLEAHFNDTPDYILAEVAVEAMENFAEASARRDNWHGFKEADKPGEVVRNEDCDNCPVRGICPEHKKPEAFDVPKEVRAMAEFFGKMFPGSKVEKPRPVCLALKETKDGHTYKITLGVEPHFHCSNGKYENGIGR